MTHCLVAAAWPILLVLRSLRVHIRLGVRVLDEDGDGIAAAVVFSDDVHVPPRRICAPCCSLGGREPVRFQLDGAAAERGSRSGDGQRPPEQRDCAQRVRRRPPRNHRYRLARHTDAARAKEEL